MPEKYLYGIKPHSTNVCKKTNKNPALWHSIYKHTSAFSSLAGKGRKAGKLSRNQAKCVIIPFEIMRYHSIFVTHSVQSSLLRFGSGGSAEQRTRLQVPSGSTSANFVDVSSQGGFLVISFRPWHSHQNRIANAAFCDVFQFLGTKLQSRVCWSLCLSVWEGGCQSERERKSWDEKRAQRGVVRQKISKV